MAVNGDTVNAETYRTTIEPKTTAELNDLADELWEKHAQSTSDDAQRALMAKLRVIDSLLLERENEE